MNFGMARVTKKYMRLGKSLIAFTIVFATFMLTACTSNPFNPIHAEAEAESNKFWDSLLIKCQNAYYVSFERQGNFIGSGYKGIFKFEDTSITVEEFPPSSEAERLNREDEKTAWVGKSQFISKLYKEYENNDSSMPNQRDKGGWGAWNDRELTLTLFLEKKQGDWRINFLGLNNSDILDAATIISGDGRYEGFKKLSGCAAIPKER